MRRKTNNYLQHEKNPNKFEQIILNVWFKNCCPPGGVLVTKVESLSNQRASRKHLFEKYFNETIKRHRIKSIH